MKKLIFILPFILFACKKNINPSKQAFYCKINGKEFIPEKDNSPIGGVGSSPLKISWDKQNGWFSIYAVNTPEFVGLTIKLLPNEPIIMTEYLLSNDLKGSKGYYSYDNTEDIISSSGKIIITKIESTKFWGTFEFKTKSLKTNQEYTISEGQFNNLSF